MRRMLALAAATAAVVALPVPAAQASYSCLPADTTTAVCVQLSECTDLCFIAPGAYVKCYLGFRGEAVCRIVRLVNFEVGGK